MCTSGGREFDETDGLGLEVIGQGSSLVWRGRLALGPLGFARPVEEQLVVVRPDNQEHRRGAVRQHLERCNGLVYALFTLPDAVRTSGSQFSLMLVKLWRSRKEKQSRKTSVLG